MRFKGLYVTWLVFQCARAVLGQGDSPSTPTAAAPGWRVGGLTLPLYSADRRTLVAVVSVRSFAVDYERRGFFRIGVLPFLVARDVTLTVHRQDALADALPGVQRALAGDGSQRPVELRGFRLRPADGSAELCATRARFQPEGSLRLSGARLRQAGLAPLELEDAALEGHSAKAGLRLRDLRTGARTWHLFDPVPSAR